MPALDPRSRDWYEAVSCPLSFRCLWPSGPSGPLSFLPGQLCLDLHLGRSQTPKIVWVWPVGRGWTWPVRISYLPGGSREHVFQARLIGIWEVLLSKFSNTDLCDHLTQTSGLGLSCLQGCCPEVRAFL